MEEMFDTMLEETVKGMVADEDPEITEDKKIEVKKTAKESLLGFLKYIRSKRFSNKCKEIAEKKNMDHKIVKNYFIASILGKIADILNLTITITAEILQYAVEFIVAVINRIVDFTYKVCTSLVNLLTLNCGGGAC